MTREELKEHCERQIQRFERVEKIIPVTPNDWKRYEEHKLILDLLEQEPIEVIRLAAKMSEQYYGKPLVITYSGGKDSDVLLHLAIKSGANIEVINSHTTVDLPPTVYHIKEVFEGLNKAGIKASVIYPRYENGTYKSMWSLIKDNRNPPRKEYEILLPRIKRNNTTK